MIQNAPTGLDKHDRLDLLMTSEEHGGNECGSLNALTGKPEYCCFDCPTLKANIKKGS